jgi:oligopeptide transport system permease protein
MSELVLADAGADVRERSRWRDAARRFTANRTALAGGAGLALLVAGCLLVPIFSPHDPYDAQYEIANQSASAEHPLGTDQHGRDVLTRLALGGRASMLVAVSATGIILVLGLVYGAIAGFAGGRLDELMMLLLDGLFAVPRLPAWIIILILIGTGGSILTLVFALSILGWMTTARLVRGEISD